METLQSLKKLRPGPYAKPVSVRVVACQKPLVYGEDKSCVNFSVADKTDYSKAVSFDKGQFSQICEGAGLILRNVILKQGGEIVLTKQTKVFQTTPPNVPDHILKLAMELIRPPAPDIKTIEETKTSPLRTMMSVIGKITQDTETNEVMVNNSPTKVRNIVIEDKTGNITIALWREHATACIRPGEYIRITHVTARNTAQGQSLQTTKHTTITDIHKELEQKIAKFHGKEDAILYISCFDANAGIFEVVLSQNDAVLSDELNHASIIDGIRLCKAQRYRYKHKDMNELEQQLKESQSCRQRMIVTDGVFSMDGDVAPLPEICDLAEKYKALVFIDECHATGFFGKTGRGTEEYYNLDNKVDLINSTLGKAVGGAAGGYTTGLKEIVDLLRQRSRPYLFSNSLPPPIVACASKAFDLIMENTDLPNKVLSNTTRFRTKMTDAGFQLTGAPDHPICPVWLGDAKLASAFADQMLERGIYVIGFSYPVVPKGKARIRVQISAAHTEADIDRAVDAFVSIGRDLKVIN